MKCCTKCGMNYSETDEYFYRRSSPRNHLFQSWCKKCTLSRDNKIAQCKFSHSPKGIYIQIKHRYFGNDLISQKDFLLWYNNQEKKCVYCGIKEEDLIKLKDTHNSKVNRLTIDRKNNLKSYEKDNIALSCNRCNSIKNDLFTFEEMKEISLKYIVPKWKNQGVIIS